MPKHPSKKDVEEKIRAQNWEFERDFKHLPPPEHFLITPYHTLQNPWGWKLEERLAIKKAPRASNTKKQGSLTPKQEHEQKADILRIARTHCK